MSHALTLYRLQQIDTRLDQVQIRLNAIRDDLENNPALKNARAQAQADQADCAAIEKNIREAEQAAQNQRIKLETAESSLYGGRIHNPKELQDLQHDTAALKRRLTELEEAQLEEMLRLETARESAAASQTALRQTESATLSQNALIRGEQSALEHETNRLHTERNAITEALPAPALQLYDSLRQKKRGLAVARVTESTCSACGNSLTPAQAQAARQAVQFIHCASCGRILFSN